jgi:MFS family permease
LAIAVTCILLSITISTIASAQYDWEPTPADAGLFMGLGLMMCCIVGIIPLIISILIGWWMSKDATKRGKSGGLWFIIGFFLGLLGLIIWLVIRPPIGGEKPAGSDRRCPNCGRTIPMDARACPYCAKKFDES